jgi:hypothetical protein
MTEETVCLCADTLQLAAGLLIYMNFIRQLRVEINNIEGFRIVTNI